MTETINTHSNEATGATPIEQILPVRGELGAEADRIMSALQGTDHSPSTQATGDAGVSTYEGRHHLPEQRAADPSAADVNQQTGVDDADDGEQRAVFAMYGRKGQPTKPKSRVRKEDAAKAEPEAEITSEETVEATPEEAVVNRRERAAKVAKDLGKATLGSLILLDKFAGRQTKRTVVAGYTPVHDKAVSTKDSAAAKIQAGKEYLAFLARTARPSVLNVRETKANYQDRKQRASAAVRNGWETALLTGQVAYDNLPGRKAVQVVRELLDANSPSLTERLESGGPGAKFLGRLALDLNIAHTAELVNEGTAWAERTKRDTQHKAQLARVHRARKLSRHQ